MITAERNIVKASTSLNVFLWIAQALLAIGFGLLGVMKMFLPIAELGGGPGGVPEALVRFIGVSEFLGAAGLLLPSILRIRPNLTVWAAAGLSVIMVLAAVFHISRNEWASIPLIAIILSLAVFISWGRSRKATVSVR